MDLMVPEQYAVMQSCAHMLQLQGLALPMLIPGFHGMYAEYAAAPALGLYVEEVPRLGPGRL